MLKQTKMTQLKSKLTPIFCVMLFAASALAEAASSDVNQTTEQLKQVQEKIKKQRQEIEQQLKNKDSLEAKFKATELKVAEVALQVRQTDTQLADVTEKISNLEQEQKQLDKKKHSQQKVLAEMVRTAYLNGKHDYTKLLLNQDDPAQLERLITYYRKLNDARVEQLVEIEQVLLRLNQIGKELDSKKNQLATLKQHQQEEKKLLVNTQLERKRALKQLNAEIKSDKSRLNQLQADQQRLANAIEQARKAAERSPSDLVGLYNLKRKLQWPTKGKLRQKFGQRRSGALRWKGVVIDARLGNRVNAIADGVVLYADWLKGFGWVTVVDHGKGYMSLYGHNQALLKQAGDFIEQNEPIALVGQSGGQSQAGLYFEIRYKGKTVNPARWCR